MKLGGVPGDSPPPATVAHSDEFCKMSAGSVPPGKLAQTSQNWPRPFTATWKPQNQNLNLTFRNLLRWRLMMSRRPLHLWHHRQPASRVGVLWGVVRWRDDGGVERCYGSHAVREAPVGEEKPRRLLQLLLRRRPQIHGAEERHDGVTHVSDTPAHGGLPHAEQSADGAVLDVGRQAPQSHRHTLLHGQRQAEAGVLAGKSRPQLLAQEKERLLTHTKLIQPIRGLELCHDHTLPPIRARRGRPGARADVEVGADASRQHHLEKWVTNFIQHLQLLNVTIKHSKISPITWKQNKCRRKKTLDCHDFLFFSLIEWPHIFPFLFHLICE